MTTNTRKIRVEAEDGGVLDLFAKLNSVSKNIAQGMLEDAGRLSTSGKIVVQALEEEIRAMERLRAVETKSELEKTRTFHRERIKTSSAWEQPHEEARFKEDISKIKAADTEAKLQTALLRELITTIKSTARDELRDRRTEVEEQVGKYRSGELGDISPEEKIKLEEQRRILDAEKGKPEDRREKTWWEMAKGMIISSGIMSAAKGMWGGAVSGARELATTRDEEETVAKLYGLAPGGSAIEAVKLRHLETSLKKGIEENKMRAIAGLAGFAGTDDGSDSTVSKDQENYDKKYNALVAKRKADRDALDAQYPVNVSGDKKLEYEKKLADLQAKQAKDWATFYNANPNPKVGNSENAYTEAGVDSIEFLSRMTSVMKASGTSVNANSMTKALIDLSKGRGLDETQLLHMMELSRYERSRGVGGLMGGVAQMESIFEGAGIGRPRLGKSLDIVNELAQSRISRGLESFNYVQLAKIKSKFERLGGTFANSSETIANIDQSLANPNNAWQEAENYRIYSQQTGGKGTYFGFKEWQEQGIGAAGLMKGRIARIRGIFGESDYAKLAMKNLVKSYAQAGKLSTMKPEEWTDISGMADKSFDTSLEGIGKGYTTKREKSQAEITEEFAKGMKEGFAKVLDKVGDELVKQLSSSGALGKTIAGILAKILNKK